jgi:hypothetical protein
MKLGMNKAMKKIIVVLTLILFCDFLFADENWALLNLFPYSNRLESEMGTDAEKIPYKGFELGSYGPYFSRKMYSVEIDNVEQNYGSMFEFHQRGYLKYIIQLNWAYEIIGEYTGLFSLKYDYIKVLCWDKKNPDKKYEIVCQKFDNLTKIEGIMISYVYLSSQNKILRFGKLLTDVDIENYGGEELVKYCMTSN